MLEIVVIGIGSGNPEHMTIEAVRALNAADLVLIPRKGAAKSDLAELRREICGRYLENQTTRLVEFEMPVRDAGSGYRQGVDAWHRAIAERYRVLLDGVDGVTALLVWGDPSLYDSTLRILDILSDDGLAFVRRIVPGVTSLQALAAAHGVPLNSVGGPLHVTTGRRLREEAHDADSVAVMLDADCAFLGVPAEGVTIYWGAYLGMPDEILIAGPLAEVAERIVEVRSTARADHGWIMDAYLLRRT
jgi:precorrin-6A synthase